MEMSFSFQLRWTVGGGSLEVLLQLSGLYFFNTCCDVSSLKMKMSNLFTLSWKIHMKGVIKNMGCELGVDGERQ